MFPTELRIPKNEERFFPLGIVNAISALIAFGLPVGAALAQVTTPTEAVEVDCAVFEGGYNGGVHALPNQWFHFACSI